MGIRAGEITRGGGKVFVHVLIDELDESDDVRAFVSAHGSVPLPSLIYPVPGISGRILCVSIFQTTQHAHVERVDSEGRILESGDFDIGFASSLLTSKFNTLTRNSVVPYFRNSDMRMRGRTNISVSLDHHIVDFLHGTDYLRGFVTVYAQSEEEASSRIEILALGADGTSCRIGDWVCLSDSISRVQGGSGAYVRTIGFSVCFSGKEHSITIWARPEEASLTGGFVTLSSKMLRDIRASTVARTLPIEAQPGYEQWFLTEHRATQCELDVQRHAEFDIMPLFSVVVPLYHTPLGYFREMASSALSQTYSNLELVLVNSTPDDAELTREISNLAAGDARVRVVTLSENLGITGNTNEGMRAARGDFVCFLDHDDTIEPDLLYWYAMEINKYPETDLLYCDEDKLKDGHYCSPFPKSDWNPDRLNSHNYITHLLCIRRTILEEMGPIVKEYEGAQDFHMALFASERARHIGHVPRFLYHWRVHEGSTAGSSTAKSYTTAAGKKSIEDHLSRIGVEGVVVPDPAYDNYYHVSYAVPCEPLVSIVIPNKDHAAMLRRCVKSLFEKTDYKNIEIIIVENNSVEEETFSCYEELSADSRVRVVYERANGEFNFSRTINFGARRASGDYLLFLNNDIEAIKPRWLHEMVGDCLQSRVGVVGAKLLYPDGLIQHAGVAVHDGYSFQLGQLLPSDTETNNRVFSSTHDCSAVTGACMLTKRDLFEKVGGMDEDLAIDCNDVDYCLKVRREGLYVVFEPEALLYHYESITRGSDDSAGVLIKNERAQGIMKSRWPEYFALGDPFMNPNLVASAYVRGPFDIAFDRPPYEASRLA